MDMVSYFQLEALDGDVWVRPVWTDRYPSVTGRNRSGWLLIHIIACSWSVCEQEECLCVSVCVCVSMPIWIGGVSV